MSAYSAVAELRLALLERQRALALRGRIIMAGRDVGTIVLPDADLKLYLDASVEERARRRAVERGVDPSSAEGLEILEELRRRDLLDSTRETAPLRKADDAIVLRTDGNSFEQSVAEVVEVIRRVAEPGPATDAAPTGERCRPSVSPPGERTARAARAATDQTDARRDAPRLALPIGDRRPSRHRPRDRPVSRRG